MRTPHEMLAQIDGAREAWNFTEDPGLGAHSFGDFDLLVNKNELGTRYVIDLDGETVTMSYNWESFFQHLTTPREWSLESVTKSEGNEMAKSGIHDEERRERTRLKCKNDWDLDLTEDQIKMCIIEEDETGLTIWHNQLWPNKRNFKKKITHDNGRYEYVSKERITWDKTIDGYRATASATGLFAGVDAPAFSYEDNEGVKDLVARVTVYRLGKNGVRQPFIGEARFGEFVQLIDEWANKKRTGKKVPNHIWAESPKNQLAVAAERQALRKAFQSCVDNQAMVMSVDERSNENEEAVSEPSRGTTAPVESTEPVETRPPEPEPPKVEEKPKGTYVGIPNGGFKAFAKYNKEERIVIFAKAKDKTILALDSGKRVTVNDEGYEIDRRDRTDNEKGGRKWSIGETYYDGSKVSKTADSKKDDTIQRLLLDSGHEVRLDRWGKETGRKERKAKTEDQPKSEAAQPDTPPHPDPADSPGEPSNIEHDPRTGGEVVDTTATKSSKPGEVLVTKGSKPEADASGDNEKLSIEDAQDVAMARKLTTELLKKWCNDVLKKRVSFKDAYEQLTGVVLQKGNKMELHDYKALYECLEDALEEANEGRKAG